MAQASNAFNSATAGLSLPAGTDMKALAAKVNALGGGIGSQLNGMTGDLTAKANSALGSLNSGITTAVSNVAGSALGGSGLGNALAGAASLAGLAGAAGNAVGGFKTAIASLGSASTLGSVFGQLSQAAGQLNNLLSLTRGKSLPAGGELFQTVGPKLAVTAVNAGDWRVRLAFPVEEVFPDNILFGPLVKTNGLIWPYLPNIKISSRANYTQQDPVHNNFPYQMYKNSQVDDINIDGEFSVQNSEEGKYWIAATMFLRSATKMFYGQGDFAGNPPIICKLTGYGTHVFNNVPVVIKNFSVDLKDDVNYIKVQVGSESTWVPAMSTISVTVSPVYNREQLRSFSLQSFANGQAIGIM
jgi:hypothetical protein